MDYCLRFFVPEGPSQTIKQENAVCRRHPSPEVVNVLLRGTLADTHADTITSQRTTYTTKRLDKSVRMEKCRQ